MKVLIASAEYAPLVHEGAAGETACGLARALGAAGCDVRVVLPGYGRLDIRRARARARKQDVFQVALGGLDVRGEFIEGALPDGTGTWLVRKDEFFDRGGVYGPEGGTYDDNAVRFTFFARAAAELARRWGADVVHALEWPAALVPVMRRAAGDAGCTVLGLAGMEYQGVFSPETFGLANLPGTWFGGEFEFFGRANWLKAGMRSADATVMNGARQAAAVRTAEYGCALEGVAEELGGRLTGILAGVDYGAWDAAVERELASCAGRGGVTRREARNAGLARFGFEPLEQGLFVVLPLALSGGRGLEVVLPVMDRLLAGPIRLLVLGAVDHPWQAETGFLRMKHAGRLAVIDGTDAAAWHLACACADAVLVPAALRPADPALALAMHSGCVPVCRACAGLHEIVEDDDPAGHRGNGFVFYRDDPEALWDVMQRALAVQAEEAAWAGLTARARERDFSWEAAGRRYRRLYENLLRGARTA